jgi:hypothetical protein
MDECKTVKDFTGAAEEIVGCQPLSLERGLR